MKAPVGLLSDRTVLRSKMEGLCPDKFAFVERSGTMKAPVGLLSDRTVLHSKMEGLCPDKSQFAVLVPNRVWGRHAPTRSCPGGAQHFQELKICGHGTVLALTPLGKGVFMDIEVKRMSPTAVEMLDQLSAVCKRFGVDYYAASQNQRDLLDSIALHEYQLKKAHEQGLKRSEVPPFLGLKRSDRSNDMPA